MEALAAFSPNQKIGAEWEEGKKMIKYEFHGSFCTHVHNGPVDKTNPFNCGWEWLTLRIQGRDFYDAPFGNFLKAMLRDMGIQWLEAAPKMRPSQELALVLGGPDAKPNPDISGEEDRIARNEKWAGLNLGDIWDDNNCSTPWCGNADQAAMLFSKWINVTIHCTSPEADQIIVTMYDWNHN